MNFHNGVLGVQSVLNDSGKNNNIYALYPGKWEPVIGATLTGVSKIPGLVLATLKANQDETWQVTAKAQNNTYHIAYEADKGKFYIYFTSFGVSRKTEIKELIPLGSSTRYTRRMEASLEKVKQTNYLLLKNTAKAAKAAKAAEAAADDADPT